MKTRSHLLLALGLLCATGGAALAQSYPTKPIRMMIGFPPGGGTDIIGRIVAQKLSEALGQQIIVDNRGGASGQLAAELLSRAAPDGYTIMMAHIAAVSILPSLVSKLPYDAQKDFAPVSLSAIGPNLLVVHPSVPVRTVKELIALAKARPGQLQYASPGAGTVQHLAGELFKLQAKVDMLHVPYKGSGQAIVEFVRLCDPRIVVAGQRPILDDRPPAGVAGDTVADVARAALPSLARPGWIGDKRARQADQARVAAQQDAFGLGRVGHPPEGHHRYARRGCLQASSQWHVGQTRVAVIRQVHLQRVVVAALGV